MSAGWWYSATQAGSSSGLVVAIGSASPLSPPPDPVKAIVCSLLVRSRSSTSAWASEVRSSVHHRIGSCARRTWPASCSVTKLVCAVRWQRSSMVE